MAMSLPDFLVMGVKEREERAGRAVQEIDGCRTGWTSWYSEVFRYRKKPGVFFSIPDHVHREEQKMKDREILFI
jgi:hypothetical protein